MVQQISLKIPNIDPQRIHPLLLAMEKRKLTQAKVSLYFHDVLSWLKSAHVSLELYRSSINKYKDKNFIETLNNDPSKKYDHFEELSFYLENAVIRLSALRDKLALTALIYYLHPKNLGKEKMKFIGCPRCKKGINIESITENNCNFGLLINILKLNKVNDDVFKNLIKIEKDQDISWVVSQRNKISHRISEYRWIGLGISPKSLTIEYEENQEIASFKLGSLNHILIDELSRIETAYNNYVLHCENLALVFFPS